jgi:hypothetical protein
VSDEERRNPQRSTLLDVSAYDGAMHKIPQSAADAVVTGLRLPGKTFLDVLDPVRPTMLVFVRHFGCIFCKEMVRDARAASLAHGDTYPAVRVICMATPSEAEPFFARLWPEVPVICDPEKVLYDSFQLKHGSFVQMFGPRVWACGFRATAKGNGPGFHRVIGDPWTMPGLFVVDPKGNILFTHEFKHAGNHPDWHAIPSLIDMKHQPTTPTAVVPTDSIRAQPGGA